LRNHSEAAWDQIAVGQAFQPDIKVRLESLTYGERRLAFPQRAEHGIT
jgi:hypothetical protein